MRTILMHSADYALHTNHDIMAFEDIFSDLKELEKNSKISKADLLEVLRKYCTNISVFDLMKFNSRFVDETDYVPNDFLRKFMRQVSIQFSHQSNQSMMKPYK